MCKANPFYFSPQVKNKLSSLTGNMHLFLRTMLWQTIRSTPLKSTKSAFFIISESHDSPSHSEYTSRDLMGARLSGSIQTVLCRLALRLLRLTTDGAYFSSWSMFLRLTRNILLRLARSIQGGAVNRGLKRFFFTL
jgi:hypothetical protein